MLEVGIIIIEDPGFLPTSNILQSIGHVTQTIKEEMSGLLVSYLLLLVLLLNLSHLTPGVKAINFLSN